METELRRCRSILRILGTGVLAFTMWDLIKPFLATLMVLPDKTEMTTEELNLELESDILVILVLALLLLFLLSIGLRIYLGFSARAEGMGKSHGKVYMGIAFVLFLVQVLLLAIFLFNIIVLKWTESSLPEIAASLLMEFSSTATMGGLAFTAAKVKRLDRELQRAG